MRGGVGIILLMVLLLGGLIALGSCLVVIPGRTSQRLNDWFVVWPEVAGKHALIKRIGAMAVGIALLGYAAFLAYDMFLVGGMLHGLLR